MAAEYLANGAQNVTLNGPFIFSASIPCNRGWVYHEDETGIFILRGIVNNPSACFATYRVTFNGNIALPTGATVGPIAIALAINGEPIQTSKALFTPAAVAADPPTDDNFGNVTSTAIITVPRGCCFTLSVENDSAGATAADPAPAILVKNANLTVSRIA